MASEQILVIEGDAAAAERTVFLLQSAGFENTISASGPEGPWLARTEGVGLVLLSDTAAHIDAAEVLSRLKGAPATRAIRVLLLAGGDAASRARWLDLGADDVLARPFDPAELLARVRAQLRTREEIAELRHHTEIAEESQKIADTAFQALAVTEKMARDAKSLGRRLRFSVTLFIAVAATMAGIFLLYSWRAHQETKRAYAAILRLERGIASEEEMVARAGRMREELERTAAGTVDQHKRILEQQSEELRTRLADATAAEVAGLRKRLDETTKHLHRIEAESRIAQGIIRTYTPSIALLHVVVAFRHQASGRRLRYAGLNPQGDPITDSEGNAILDLEGRGPEVRADFFGTAFLVAADGRLLSNRHVIEPWWKNEELRSAAAQGFDTVIAEITAYFPDSTAGVRAEVRRVSPEVDLAVVQASLGTLKREVLKLDARREAAVSGQPVVLIGYATGLDAILARAGEETVRAILGATNGEPKQVMAELARRNLIRPLATQGHVGDLLPDKIVYDAQTTSGGSGGPLFNAQGKVIGVNFAVIRGFGGSNFGIPIRFAEPLLK